MDSFKQFVDRLLQILIQVGNLLIAAIVSVEVWLRGALAQAGVPPMMQTVLMLALAALLIVGSLRLFGGLIRIAIVLVLLLIAAHIILPVLPA